MSWRFACIVAGRVSSPGSERDCAYFPNGPSPANYCAGCRKANKRSIGAAKVCSAMRLDLLEIGAAVWQKTPLRFDATIRLARLFCGEIELLRSRGDWQRVRPN